MLDKAPRDIVDIHPERRAVVIEVDEDVCLACGSGSKTQAHLYAKYPSGATAAFCAHHGTEKLDELKAAGCQIIDYRYRAWE